MLSCFQSQGIFAFIFTIFIIHGTFDLLTFFSFDFPGGFYNYRPVNTLRVAEIFWFGFDFGLGDGITVQNFEEKFPCVRILTGVAEWAF